MGQRSEHVKRRRHTAEQIVRKLREADRLLAEGTEVPEVATLSTNKCRRDPDAGHKRVGVN
jgi:hypothetical protein